MRLMETNRQEEIKIEGRDNKGRFVKGQSGNPTGKNGCKLIADLIEALERESKRQGYKNFDEVVSKRALQYETVLIAVMKKVYPEQPLIDQSSHKTYAIFDYSKLTEEDIERIHNTNKRISTA